MLPEQLMLTMTHNKIRFFIVTHGALHCVMLTGVVISPQKFQQLIQNAVIFSHLLQYYVWVSPWGCVGYEL